MFRRWSRFCSRLEEDALGLVKAYDMGNPAGPAQHPGSHVRRAGASSALAADAAGARSVASLLDPLLASCGLSDSRILRVVALCPCSGSVAESDDAAPKGGDGGSDLILRDLEQRANLAAKGLFGCGRGSHRKQAGVGGVEAALLGNGRASSAVPVVAENSRLGVADAFRQAVFCGNPGLVAALSRGGDAAPIRLGRSSGGSASTGSLARPRAATGSRRPSMFGVGYNGAGKGIVGGRKGDRCGGSRSLSEGEWEEPLQALLGKGNDDGDGDDDGTGERCTVVGSEPGLILSSSHLLWTLQPPFGATDDARLLMAGDDEMDGGNSGGDGGGGCKNRGDIGDANSSAPRRERAIGAGPAAGGMHAWDCPGGQARVDTAAARGVSRRQRLALDLAWLGAAPVGSRVYYCLEEAQWEASRWKNPVRRGTSGCRAPRRKSRRHSLGSDPPGDTAAEEQRERSRGDISSLNGPDTSKSGLGDNRADAGSRAGGVSRGEWRRQNATAADADARKEAAAMVFARSVSGMLAEAYLGDAKARPGEDNARLHEETAGKGSREGAAAGPSHGARKGRAWGSLADAPPASVETAVASLVVSRIADGHRNNSCLDANDDDAVEERRLLEALDAIPDVLVAEVGAEESKLAGKWRRAVESPPEESLDSAVASGARKPHGRRRPPAESSGWRGGAQTPSTPVNASLHFAPAGVLQLLGTAHCREFVEALPPAARARVLALYEGFPDNTPPVGHLYVPLASAGSRASLSSTGMGVSSRGRHPAHGLRKAADRSRPGGERVPTHPEDRGGTRPVSAAVEVGANAAVSDLPPPASGTTPALLGALVHTLPAQAVRELLQVYLATTRVVGAVSVGGVAAGEGVGVRRRTSGLLVLPPPLPPLPPPPFLARDHGAAATRTAGVDDDKKDENVKGGRRSKSGPGRWRAVPRGGTSEERRAKGLPEKRGDDGMKGVAGWLCAAAMPPSAVDVIPDALGSGDRVTGGPSLSLIGSTEGSALGPPGRGAKRQAPFRNDSPDNFIDGTVTGEELKDQTSVGGRRAQTSDAAIIGAGRGVSARAVVAVTGTATEDVAISSSLRAPYHHAYVAVLAPPPPPSAVVNGTGDGNVTGIGNGNITSSGNSNSNGNSNANSSGNGARVAAAAGDTIDPFSNASALILQVERIVREPPRCDALESGGYGLTGAPATTSGSGNGKGGCDEVMVMGDTRGQQGAREMPPRVCGWRACLADAAAG